MPNQTSVEKKQLNIGYMRLTDAAPLIMARELGLYREQGLEVNLVREVSWANMRDRLAIGEFDAAHMLSPLPLTAYLGIGGFPVRMITGLGLALNGNAIVLSLKLFEGLESRLPENWIGDPNASAHALKSRIEWRRSRQLPPITLATVHPFSMHTLLVREWLGQAGVDTDRDIRLVVLPPEQMADQLSSGLIDGFCAGAPWPTRAVQQSHAVWIATGPRIWPDSLEKVLTVTESWHEQNPQTHLRLRMALMKACRWLDNPDNRKQAVGILCRSDCLDLPENALKALTGNLVYASWESPAEDNGYHLFHDKACGLPWQPHADWCLNQISRLLRKPLSAEEIRETSEAVYRQDLYEEALAGLGWPDDKNALQQRSMP